MTRKSFFTNFSTYTYMVSQLEKEVISGLTAGTITTIVTHPLDLVKVRSQLDTQHKGFQSYKHIFSQLKSDPNTMRASYRGLGVNLIGNSLAWASYFGLYRVFKNTWGVPDKQMSSYMYMISAWCSGLTTALVTNPIWVIKTRILSTSHGSGYKSTWDGVKNVYREGALFKGLLPSVFGVCQGSLYFTVYDTLRHKFHGDGKLSNWEYIYITSLSKMISVSSVYPLQLTKARMQSFSDTGEGWLHCIKEIFKREGYSGFYKGLGANLTRSVPATCITFVVYENLKHVL